MTNEEVIGYLKDIKYITSNVIHNEDERKNVQEALNKAIKALRYRPITLQEHDAESRRLRAILDTETEYIYTYKITKQDACMLGMTIEDVKNA